MSQCDPALKALLIKNMENNALRLHGRVGKVIATKDTATATRLKLFHRVPVRVISVARIKHHVVPNIDRKMCGMEIENMKVSILEALWNASDNLPAFTLLVDECERLAVAHKQFRKLAALEHGSCLEEVEEFVIKLNDIIDRLTKISSAVSTIYTTHISDVQDWPVITTETTGTRLWLQTQCNTLRLMMNEIIWDFAKDGSDLDSILCIFQDLHNKVFIQINDPHLQDSEGEIIDDLHMKLVEIRIRFFELDQ